MCEELITQLATIRVSIVVSRIEKKDDVTVILVAVVRFKTRVCVIQYLVYAF